MSSIYPYFYMIARWIIALSSVGLALAWVSYFVKTAYRRSPLAVFTSPDGKTLDVFATENIIGRTSNADISIPLKNVQKRHALLSFKSGHWVLAPLDGRIAINLQNVSRPAPLDYGDTITIGGQTLTFKYKNIDDISSKREPSGFLPTFLLTIFQIFIYKNRSGISGNDQRMVLWRGNQA